MNTGTNIKTNENTQGNPNTNMSMTDKDIMNDILFFTKAECDLYMHGTIEANNPNFHETFKNVLLETLAIQNETYKTMQQKGWYPVEQVQKQKIEQTKQKLANS